MPKQCRRCRSKANSMDTAAASNNEQTKENPVILWKWKAQTESRERVEQTEADCWHNRFNLYKKTRRAKVIKFSDEIEPTAFMNKHLKNWSTTSLSMTRHYIVDDRLLTILWRCKHRNKDIFKNIWDVRLMLCVSRIYFGFADMINPEFVYWVLNCFAHEGLIFFILKNSVYFRHLPVILKAI